METNPPAAFVWTSSPLDEYLASYGVKEEEVDEGRLKVEAFLAVKEQVDPFRATPPSAPSPPAGLFSAVWASARSALFPRRASTLLVERLAANLSVAPRRLEAGQLTRLCENVCYFLGLFTLISSKIMF